jgi:aerobic-type carbon monoxide dehydrogenase small subunit (CoxS/CutS family)
MKIKFQLNGQPRVVDTAPMRRLLDVLREDLQLTGTKEGCGEGECGTCTVLLDGDPVNACMVVIGQVMGRELETVEGLGSAEHLSPIQRTFIEDGGAQCGICTPGMLISTEALLRKNPSPSDVEIREALAGNLCRCTGYERIVESVRRAARLRGEGEAQ